MSELDKKINQHFSGLVVRKDLVKIVKGNAIVPSYVLEYLLGQYCATSDEESIKSGIKTVKEVLRKHYVHRNEAGLVKSTIKEKGRYKIIDKVSVALNDKHDVYEASYSNLGVKKVLVDSDTIKRHPKLLVGGVWCIVDLEYDKRRYTSSLGDQYAVSIVLAGEERRSIHKPQRCLKGQGFAIVDKHILDVPLANGEKLRAMVLDLKPQGRNPSPPASYAFWFSTTNVRTPYNWERLLRVAQDRVFLNRVPEWAYVGVMTRRYPGNDAHLTRLERFLGSLYPRIRNDAEGDAPQ